MIGYTKMPKKQFFIIMITSAILILFSSLEVLMKVKDMALFEQWMREATEIGIEEMTFDLYVSSQMSHYFAKIIIPFIFAIYTYVSYAKIRINTLYVFMWSVLILGSLAYSISDFNIQSLFFYGFIIGYAVLLITVLSLLQVIQDHKSK
jgi:hypothetical protein